MILNLNKENRTELLSVFIIFLTALLLRLYISSIFFGISGDEFCNIWCVRNTLDSKFTNYPDLFMWFYYFISAAFVVFIKDAYLAAKSVTIFFGSASIILVYLVVKHVFNKRTAICTSLLLTFHPEFILVSSVPLREPVYTFFIFLGLYFLVKGFYINGAMSIGMSFLTRLEGLWAGMSAYILGLFINKTKKIIIFYSLLIFVCFLIFMDFQIKNKLFDSLFRVYHCTANEHSRLNSVEVKRSSLSQFSSIIIMLKIFPRLIFFSIGLGIIPLFISWHILIREKYFLKKFHLAFFAFLFMHLFIWMMYIVIFNGWLPWCWRYLYPLLPFLCAYISYAILKLYENHKYKFISVCLLSVVLLSYPYIFLKGNGAHLSTINNASKIQMEASDWIRINIPPDKVILIDGTPFFYLYRYENNQKIIRWEDYYNVIPRDVRGFFDFLDEKGIKYVVYTNYSWTARDIAPFLENPKEIPDGLNKLKPIYYKKTEEGACVIIYEH